MNQDQLEDIANKWMAETTNGDPTNLPDNDDDTDDDTDDDVVDETEDEADTDETGDSDAGGAGDGEGDAGDATTSISPPPPESAPAASAPAAEDVWTLADGTRVTRDDAVAMANLARYLHDNPHVMQAMQEAGARGQPAAAAAPEPPAPPADLDLEDPVTRAMWDAFQSERTRQEQEIAQLRDIIQQHDEQLTYTQQQSMQSAYIAARDQWAQEQQLEPAQVAEVEQVVGRMGLINAYMAQVDPVSGVPRAADPQQAVRDAFAAGMMMLPDVRDRMIQQTEEQRAKNRKRKSRASSLSGPRGGSVRNQPDNDTLKGKSLWERAELMAEELTNLSTGS